MIKKLNNQEWQEKIEEYYTNYSFMPINKFCEENNLSKQQFHYHKKKRINSESTTNTLFQEVSITSTEVLAQKIIETKAEIKISIGNSLIKVPASETAIISLIIKDLISQC